MQIIVMPSLANEIAVSITCLTRLRALSGEPCENAVEDTEPAPDEAVVKRLVRTILLGRILQLQAMRIT